MDTNALVRFFALPVAAAALLLAVGCRENRTPGTGPVDDARLFAAAAEPRNWLINGGTFNGENYSTLDQINIDTVKDLKPAWYFEYDTYRGQEAQPLVVDGVMYVSTSWSKVYALDAATGKELWFYDPEVPGEKGVDACCDTVNRGVAFYKGRVYVATLDGRLVALDAGTGKVAWSTATFDPTSAYTITGAPRVVKDKVVIGNGGADFGVRGYVSAYDAATGKMVWRFYTAPGDPAKGPDGAASDEIMEKLVRPTWSGDYVRLGAGGTAWNAIMYDQDLDQLYIGTGNGSPWNPKYRTDGKGDNLFLCSVIALDPDTGRYKWHYQENPQEAWDYNSVQPMVLADLKIGGQDRKALLHVPKNGFFYVIDRRTGKVISAEPIVPVTWATGIDLTTGRPKEVPNVRYTEGPFTTAPSASGSHNWHPISFDPKRGLVYMSAQENTTTIRDNPDFKPATKGPVNTGTVTSHTVGPSWLLAWNPVTQKQAWRVPVDGRAGTLATAGGLVFYGEGLLTGTLTAFRSDNGARIWSYKTPNGIQSGAITYSIGGVQYVAITTGHGAGGLAGSAEPLERQNGRMVVFKLGGTATLPAPAALARPANPAKDRFTPIQVADGGEDYRVYCSRCHGGKAATANVIPDLRRSPVLTARDTWQTIVFDGALVANGMVGWSQHLSRERVEAIRAYVSAQAELLARSGSKKSGPLISDQ